MNLSFVLFVGLVVMKMKINDEVNAQRQFEQHIELLITYKKCNLDKDVYLNLDSLDKALKWYHNIAKDINPEMVKELRKKMGTITLVTPPFLPYLIELLIRFINTCCILSLSPTTILD